MPINPRNFIESATLQAPSKMELESVREADQALNLDKLPTGVVSGTTLIDFSATPSLAVRAGVSMSMLFASRLATKAMKLDDNEDDWLSAYTSNLTRLGFSLSGSSLVHSRFKKTGVEVHKAIIPFLTIAFGGGAVGPIIIAALQNLQEMNKDSPWITLFDSQSRRFDIRELHFAAVSSTETDTSVHYAIARLHVDTSQTSVLFFKLSKESADFESSTTSMTANNSLLAVIEPDLRIKLGQQSQSFIAAAEL